MKKKKIPFLVVFVVAVALIVLFKYAMTWAPDFSIIWSLLSLNVYAAFILRVIQPFAIKKGKPMTQLQVVSIFSFCSVLSLASNLLVEKNEIIRYIILVACVVIIVGTVLFARSKKNHA